MKQKKRILVSVLLCLSILSTLFVNSVHAAITLTSNQTGTYEGYDYELWKDSGNTTMTRRPTRRGLEVHHRPLEPEVLSREVDRSLGRETPADDLQRFFDPVHRVRARQPVGLDVHAFTRTDPQDRGTLG